MIRRFLLFWQLRRARLETERRLQAMRDCPRCREREAVLQCVRRWLECEDTNVKYLGATLRSCVEALSERNPKRKTEDEQ